MIPVYKSDLLPNNIKHGFFTRNGGISENEYQSFNLGNHTLDSLDNIQTNKNILAKYLNIDVEKIITIKQIHSNQPIIINEQNYHQSFTGDALITKTENLAIGVLTADCTPILVADLQQNIIAAIHSGWRSAYSGIIQNTIEKMLKLGASKQNLLAIIGPSICQKNYEVDKEFKNKFITKNKVYDKFFITKANNKFLFDLPTFNAFQFELLQIKFHNLNLCTYEKERDFFSFRRSSQKQELNCGRQISVIMLHKA